MIRFKTEIIELFICMLYNILSPLTILAICLRLYISELSLIALGYINQNVAQIYPLSSKGQITVIKTFTRLILFCHLFLPTLTICYIKSLELLKVHAFELFFLNFIGFHLHKYTLQNMNMACQIYKATCE